jgi:hypothetical protein
MRLESRTTAAAFATVCGVALLLTGCEDSPTASLSVGLKSGILQVANCESDVHGPVELSVSQDLETFEETFLASMESDWPRGDVVNTDPLSWDAVEVAGPPVVAPGTRLVVRYYSADGARVARITLPETGLEAGVWIRSDGSLSRRACETR